MNKQTIITFHTRCFYDVSFPLAQSRRVLLNPMEIHIKGNLLLFALVGKTHRCSSITHGYFSAEASYLVIRVRYLER